jgi:hypothetical protein
LTNTGALAAKPLLVESHSQNCLREIAMCDPFNECGERFFQDNNEVTLLSNL